jgi:membrane protein DedA with SNARE-associated domain
VDQIMSLPFGVALAALFAIVMIRVNATYWIGRGAVAGFSHTRFGGSLQGPKAARAQALIQRWGPYAVVLSFLTIGLQTAINLAAGAARMPVRRYLPAAIVGSVIWACSMQPSASPLWRPGWRLQRLRPWEPGWLPLHWLPLPYGWS